MPVRVDRGRSIRNVMGQRKFKNTKTAKVLGWTALSVTTTAFLLYIGFWMYFWGILFYAALARTTGIWDGS